MNKTYPASAPAFSLDFEKTASVIPQMECIATTGATFIDVDGKLKTSKENTPVISHNSDHGTGLYAWGGATNLCDNPTVTNDIGDKMFISNTVPAVKAPDGITDIRFVEETLTINSERYSGDFVTNLQAGAYVWSAFFKINKDAPNRYVVLRVAKTGGVYNDHKAFKFENNRWSLVTPSDSAGVENLRDGWCRAWFRFTMPEAATGYTLRVQLYKDSNRIYDGESGAGYYVWGKQLTKGFLISPYIPTNGSQASISPSQYSFTKIKPNRKTGSLFVKYIQPLKGELTHIAGFSTPNISSNYIIVGLAVTGAPRLRMSLNGLTLQSNTSVPKTGDIVRLAISYNLDTKKFIIAVNGVVDEVVADVSQAELEDNMNLRVGWGNGGENAYLNSIVKYLSYYGGALTAEELKTLTT